MSTRGAIETKMETLINEGSSDAMDIARQVKIKTITTDKNKAIQAMVKGIIIEKNPATKHMQSNISRPSILVIEGSIDLDSISSFVKFEELIKNDKAYLNKILEKIIRLNPDIIFVENHVHVYALEYLQSKEIMVINKLKVKNLDLIR